MALGDTTTDLPVEPTPAPSPGDNQASTAPGVTYTKVGYNDRREIYQGSDGRYYVQNLDPSGQPVYAPIDLRPEEIYDTFDGGTSNGTGSGGSGGMDSGGDGTLDASVPPPSAEFGAEPINPAYLAPWTQAPPQVASPPVFTPPTPYQPPSYAPPPDFSYEGFQAPTPFQTPQPFEFQAFDVPTLEEAQQQPGYQFAVDQGLRALQQSAAAKGVLRTGGTLKDLINYGQAAATQNYQNVFNNDLSAYAANQGNALNAYQLNFQNALNAYQGNYGNALNAYKTNYDTALGQYATNYGVGADTYNRLYQGSQDAYNSLYQGSQDQFNSIAAQNAADYQRAMDRFNTQYQIYRNNQSDPFNKQLSLAQLGAQTAGVA